MKKALKTIVALSAALALSIPAAGVFAEEAAPAAKAGWTTVYATVKSLPQTADAKQITVTTDDGQDVVYNLKDTYIYDQITASPVEASVIEAGLPVEAYYPANTPIAQSFPPQVSPVVLVVRNGATGLPNSKVDVFTDGLSSDGKLRLPSSIPPEALFAPEDKPFKDTAALANPITLLVFWGAETKSLPPQAVVDKAVVLEYALVSENPPFVPAPGDLQTLTPMVPTLPAMDGDSEFVKTFVRTHFWGAQVTAKNGVTYVQLRELAELMGFDVAWDASWNANKVTITRGRVSYTVTVGDTAYAYNRAAASFGSAPFIQGGRVYVEAAFIERFVK